MATFVPIWKQAITQSPFGGKLFGKRKTAAFRVTVPAAGAALRLRFSNRYGKAPYVFSAAVISLGGKDYPVTLGGSTRFAVPTGGCICSDPLELPVKKGAEAEVRLYYETYIIDGNVIEEEACLLPGDRTKTVCCDGGAKGSGLLQKAGVYNAIPSLETVELLTDAPLKTVVAFGDSITAMSQWTKPLAKRLNGETDGTYVLLNAGISGNCLLYERPDFLAPMFGEMGMKRFERDVLNTPHLHAVLFALGVNDAAYYTEKTKEQLSLDAFRRAVTQITDTLHAQNVRVIIQTITPRIGCARIMGTYTKEMEAQRLQFNDWIRTAGIFDGVFDAEAVVKAETPEGIIFRDDLHRGDRLHPNAKGGQLLADAFDLSMLL